jgi:L-Ala-D/L-Glu epimerase
VRLCEATVHMLRLPFVESFSHSAKARRACDSVVVRVVDDDGVAGFGEGAARPYVTGETPRSVFEHLASELWPAVVGIELPDRADDVLTVLDAVMPSPTSPRAVSANAARCALELAVLDCRLRSIGASVAALLPPRRPVIYGGVITAGDPGAAARRARQMKLIGLRHLKLKVGTGRDLECVRAVREAAGPEVSLRLDANGAWSLDEALQVADAVAPLEVAPLEVAALEQPLARNALRDLRTLRRASPIPLMADESVVTLDDAETLLAAEAVDMLNIRISKCGGLHRSTLIAELAISAGVGVQVGCHVGETAILSAAGRHLAAWAPEVAFVEGSFGTLLLVEDLSAEPVQFGYGGRSSALTGPGLGVDVVEERLRRYSTAVVALAPAGARR